MVFNDFYSSSSNFRCILLLITADTTPPPPPRIRGHRFVYSRPQAWRLTVITNTASGLDNNNTDILVVKHNIMLLLSHLCMNWESDL